MNTDDLFCNWRGKTGTATKCTRPHLINSHRCHAHADSVVGDRRKLINGRNTMFRPVARPLSDGEELPRCSGTTISGRQCVQSAWQDGLCGSHLSKRKTAQMRQRDLDAEEIEADLDHPAAVAVSVDDVEIDFGPPDELATLVELTDENPQSRWPDGSRRTRCAYMNPRKPFTRCTHSANIGTQTCSRHIGAEVGVTIAV